MIRKVTPQMNRPLYILSLALTLILTACRSTPLESAANTLNRDLDLAKSPIQFIVNEDEQRLARVLRKMPVAPTAADATLRADIERVIAQKLNSPPRIVEIRIFETQPNLRREIWVAEKDGTQLAFDVVLTVGSQGSHCTVAGPVAIEGAL